MPTAPRRTATGGYLRSGSAGLLALALSTSLISGCVPEHVQQHYAATAAGQTRFASQRRHPQQARRTDASQRAMRSRQAEPTEQSRRAEPSSQTEPSQHAEQSAQAKEPERVEKMARGESIAAIDPALLMPADPPECGSSGIATASNPEPREREASKPAAGGDERNASSAAPSPASNAGANQQPTELEVRIALEYERACFKQAEARVREQLQKLQRSVGETIKAVESRAAGGN